jgi:uncharacterized protein YbjT (DUF2867 family)
MEANIVITGGTGRLGRVFSNALTGKNIAHIITSRIQPKSAQNWMFMNLSNGNGMSEALRNKKIVVHLASGTKKYDKNIDVNGTQRLLQASKENGVEHFIYVSIVGIDKVPMSYYKLKLEAEELVKKAGVPYTIFRATQFHEFLDQMFHQFLFFPIVILPTHIKIQPVDTSDVTDVLLQLIQQSPSNQTIDLGGPEVLELGSILESWKAAQHKRKWILHLPTFGNTLRALNDGALTCPDKPSKGILWEQWLKNKYGG